MIGRLVVIGWLSIVWAALWGDFDLANLLAGAFVSAAIVAMFPIEQPFTPHARPIATARLLAVFVWRLIAASAVVAWEILTPSSRINEGIVAVPVRGMSDLLRMIVANAISLTPGTLTLEVDRDGEMLYVHVLHLRDIESVRREIGELAVLVVKAFGSPEAIAALATPHPSAGPGGDPR